MSGNQSRADKGEPPLYRKTGRSGSYGQQRNSFAGGSGKAGGSAGTAPSRRKASNAQGAQSRNGAHSQPAARGAYDAPVTSATVKLTDVSAQKSTRGVPKAPSSNAAAAVVTFDAALPATPAKGDASKSFPLQFGSISPGLMNGMQARHDSVRATPALPTPTIPKQQSPRKDAVAIDQSNNTDSHLMSKVKRDVQVSAAPPVTQTQKPSVHPISGMSMQIPFHQPQVPGQFGGLAPQMQSQAMTNPSLSLPMPMPLPLGNPSQVQQQLFVPNLQSHLMQSQGIMHQGQSLNFSSQMGQQLPPQMGNVVSITAQFQQQQAGKYGSNRRTVKITHPDTHEELRLDGSSSVARSHPSTPPQSQPIPSFPPPARPINYYPNPNAYNAGSMFFPPPNSLPLSSAQVPPSQAPRFYNPVSQGPPSVSFMNPSSHNSFSVNKSGSSVHGVTESSNLEDNAITSAPSASVKVIAKPAGSSHGEKVAGTSLSMSPPAGKSDARKTSRPKEEDRLLLPQRDTESVSDISQQRSVAASMSVTSQQSTAASSSISAESQRTYSLSSATAAALSVEDSTSVLTSSSEGTKNETVNRSSLSKGDEKKPSKKVQSLPQSQVSVQSTSALSFPPTSSELGVPSKSGIHATLEPATTSVLSGSSAAVQEPTKEVLVTTSIATPHASDTKNVDTGVVEGCESPEIVTADIMVDTSLGTDLLKSEMVGLNEPIHLSVTKPEQGETLLPEFSKQDEKHLEISSEPSLLKDFESVNQSEQNSVLEVTIATKETRSRRLEESVGRSIKDVNAGDLLMSTSVADALDTGTSSVTDGVSTVPLGNELDCEEFAESDVVDKDSPPVSIPSLSEVASRREEEGAESVITGLLSPSASGSKDKHLLERAKGTGSKAKKKRKEILQKADAAGTTSDLYMAYKGPEEKIGTTTSTGSSESTSRISLKQVSADISGEDGASTEKGGQGKSEPDDWEDAADISTPKLEATDSGNQVRGEDGNGEMAKKYSRDFLLTFSDQCTDLPEEFEITSDIAEALIVSNINVSRESFPSPGRVNDKQTGGSRLDRRGSGMGDDEKWSKFPGPLASGRDMRLDIGFGGNVVGMRPGQGGNYGVLRNPRGQAPGQYPGGILLGPMQSPGSGMQRNSSDSERWQRATGFHKGLIPSPHTPLQVMHKAERKYEVGKITDEEQAKQRQLKGILNKLTPQNFEKLFEQVKQVNIDNAGTLTDVISQIFDKALMEPTFCEMYANFCYHLAGDLPDFGEDNEKITFKRLLLNKCQEEFERGEREEEEANRADEEGGFKQSEEEREEKRVRARRRMLGNIRLIGELYKKKMLTERIMHECIKKLLGQYQNPDEEDVEALCKLMSTIGEMIDHPKAKEHMDAYFDMMTKLSNNMKLSSRLRFLLKDAVDLRKNKWQQRRKVEGPKKIEEVHRDALQERQAQTTRLSRGPSIGSSARRGQPMDFAPRGSNMVSPTYTQMGGFRGPPQQLRGYGAQDVRSDERHAFENRALSVPLPQRPIGDDSITLGPQGGLARGMSIRGQPSVQSLSSSDMPHPGDSRRMTAGLNGYSSVSDRTAYGSREDPIPRNIPERLVTPSAHDQSSTQERNLNYVNRELRNADRSFDRSLPASPPTRSRAPTLTQNVSSERVWSEERLRDMSVEAIKEYYRFLSDFKLLNVMYIAVVLSFNYLHYWMENYFHASSVKDEKEVALCIKDLNSPTFYPSMISIWVTDSFERKDMERDLLAKLLINLTKSHDSMLNQDQLIKGFESVLATLEDAVNDAPKAAEFLGRIFAKVILENVITITEIGRLIYEGGEEQGRLVEIGLAAEVLGSILEIIKSEKGDPVLNEIRGGSSLRLENFRPRDSRKAWRLDKFI
ncbi:hypothetical protein RJ640_028786 [Escallonia rubra]|uniref:Eukaryotic translation initiation factor 4G n=1 Tax=Escallonia rubra TaxID=112253 RepID=A0AA88QTY3_9ASTE|nr:hypothetical protein RJ640_028786 [Escallonia rubra]